MMVSIQRRCSTPLPQIIQKGAGSGLPVIIAALAALFMLCSERLTHISAFIPDVPEYYMRETCSHAAILSRNTMFQKKKLSEIVDILPVWHYNMPIV